MGRQCHRIYTRSDKLLIIPLSIWSMWTRHLRLSNKLTMHSQVTRQKIRTTKGAKQLTNGPKWSISWSRTLRSLFKWSASWIKGRPPIKNNLHWIPKIKSLKSYNQGRLASNQVSIGPDYFKIAHLAKLLLRTSLKEVPEGKAMWCLLTRLNKTQLFLNISHPNKDRGLIPGGKITAQCITFNHGQ